MEQKAANSISGLNFFRLRLSYLLTLRHMKFIFKTFPLFQDLEKKYQLAISEQEQNQLRYKVLQEENKTLRADLVKSNKEKVAAQSKVSEVEAKLSVHCKGKEACLEKIESLQNKLNGWYLNRKIANEPLRVVISYNDLIDKIRYLLFIHSF